MKLGDRVRIVSSRDVEGVLVSHTRYLDGSERWEVQYWDAGKRMEVMCLTQDLCIVAEIKA